MSSLEICDGNKTRRRKLKKKTVEAVLDFFIVCEKIHAFIEKMIIDENREYPLSRFMKDGKTHRDHHGSLNQKIIKKFSF